MNCNVCGTPLEADAAFCPACGAVVPTGQQLNASPAPAVQPVVIAPAAASQSTAAAPAVEGKSRAGVVVAVVAAAIAVVAAIVVGSGVFGGSSDQSSGSSSRLAASSSAAASSSSQSAEAQVVSYNGPCVVVKMPAEYARQGYTWKSASDTMTLYDASDTSKIVATIVWGETANHGDEAKSTRVQLGAVTNDGATSSAVLSVLQLDENGKTIYAGLDKTGTLASEVYLGITPDEIASWIEVNGDQAGGKSSGSSATSAAPATGAAGGGTASGSASASAGAAAGGTSPQPATGVSKRTAPFWGVWISASKDLDEAVATAQEATSRGLQGEVFMTTDWSNLNPEPWYVVAAGCLNSESEANALVSKAQKAGYENAYAKHSGDYVG